MKLLKLKLGVVLLPYGESEYALWEDHWILCSEKLQHWDILTDLARHEGFQIFFWNVVGELLIGIMIETLDQTVKNVMDVPTPRRQVFETFCVCKDLVKRKKHYKTCHVCVMKVFNWHYVSGTDYQKDLPMHIPLLHTFQQYVEFMEASQVYASLVTTNAQNLDMKSQELKRVLQVWRERLPNVWDDINIWNDLVTWRQHAFQVINKVYMPFIPVLQQNSTEAMLTHMHTVDSMRLLGSSIDLHMLLESITCQKSVSKS